MDFLNKIEKFSSNVCFIDENGREVLYKNVLIKSEKLSKDLKPRSLIFGEVFLSPQVLWLQVKKNKYCKNIKTIENIIISCVKNVSKE